MYHSLSVRPVIVILRSILITVCLVGATIAAGPLPADPVPFDIGQQPLRLALTEFARQSDRELLFSTEVVEDKVANHVDGTYEPEDALELLLTDTGLEYSVTANDTILVAEEGGGPNQGKGNARAKPILMAQNQTPAEENQTASTKSDDDEEEELELEKVTVVGTRIKGARPASPVVTITQEEMRLQGHNNLGEVIRALPQNFSGGQNPTVAQGASVGASSSNFNSTGSSSLNLRGLGPDATLTLLNGTRLPYDGTSQATDVSVIPVAAIERVEILLDGASAIYGSDAVGGVANIVLKRDYEGAELSARFGAATDGGYGQQQYSAVIGTNWGSGGFLITGDYSDTDSVKARQRDTLSYIPNPNLTIYPQQTQKGALLTGHQEIGAFAIFNLDAFYTKRSQEILSQTSASPFFEIGLDSSIWGVAPSLDFELPGDWSAHLHGAFGRNEVIDTLTGFSATTGAQTSDRVADRFNGMQAVGIELEGPLFALPGGDARASTGGGYRRNTFDRTVTDLITGAISGTVDASEGGYYLYGEIDLPLVSEDQNLPLMNRLTLNAAVRHENYDSFGGSTTPKIGAIWGLAPGFDLKASWGRSFKIPTQFEQHQATTSVLYPGPSFGAPAGSQVFGLFGGNPNLAPETAEIITAGFVAQPEFLPGFTLEFGYFDIDYTDRVVRPVDLFFEALSNPVFAEFVTLSPTIAQQDAAFAATGLPVGTVSFNISGAPYDPATTVAIVDNRFTNASAHRVKGIDLTARHVTDLFDGRFSLSGNGSWITDGTRKLTDLAPEQQAAGVNFWPAKFKGRLAAGWSREGFSLNANLNHIAGIIDRNVTPNVKRDSMTTVDLIVDYQWDSDLIGDVGFSLAVTNLFNEAPPLLASPVASIAAFLVNYDSTNYSALGRVVSATITKRF